MPFYVNACHELGIEVLPPDVNASQIDFAVVEGKIRFGLNAVKNVGETAARAIVARARGGRAVRRRSGTSPSASTRRSSNKRALESLVKCGALDSTGAARRGCSRCSSRRSPAGRSSRPTGSLGQGSIFDLGDGRATSAPRHHPPIPPSEFEKHELLRLEKETLGLYVSEHPLTPIRDQLRAQDRLRRSPSSSGAATARSSPSAASSARVKQLTTKKGEPMVFLRLDDVTGGAEVRRLQLRLRRRRASCSSTDRILIVKGRVDHKEGETKLVAHGGHARSRRSPEQQRGAAAGRRAQGAGRARSASSPRSSSDFPGEAPVYRRPRHVASGPKTLELGPEYRVAPSRTSSPR